MRLEHHNVLGQSVDHDSRLSGQIGLHKGGSKKPKRKQKKSSQNHKKPSGK
jgi:hypothetical protein